MGEVLQNVEVPSPQFNTLLRNLNTEIIHDRRIYRDMPFRAESDGSIHFLGQNNTSYQRMASSGVPLPHLATQSNGDSNLSEHPSSTAPSYSRMVSVERNSPHPQPSSNSSTLSSSGMRRVPSGTLRGREMSRMSNGYSRQVSNA